MAIALYAGSFDPITLGHMDIIRTGADMFDKLIIGIAYNSGKTSLIPVSERIALIQQCVKDIQNVEVCSFDGLTVDYAKQNNIFVLLRGIRNSEDYEYEKELAQVNSKLNPDIKTVFLPAKPEHACVSSSTAKEIYRNNGDLSEFLPQNVIDYLVAPSLIIEGRDG